MDVSELVWQIIWKKKLIEKVKYKNQKIKERCGLSDNFALKNKKRMEKKQSLR